MRPATPLPLLISDGVVEEFSATPEAAKGKRKKKVAKSAPVAQPETVELNHDGMALAERLREWCKAEARRLRLPAYFILNDPTLKRVADARPCTTKQLLAIDGLGPAKVEKFGAAILDLCRDRNAS